MNEHDLERLCLNRKDLERVAEFFECDADAAFDFVRKVWLPDAKETALRLTHAIARRDWHAAVYLCDKLREGARCVGATRIMQYANDIEHSTRRRKWCWLGERATELNAALDTLSKLLLDCADSPT